MLKDFVTRLKREPLLLKAYTAQALCSIQDRLEEDDIPDLAKAAKFTVEPTDSYFDDVTKLSHVAALVRHLAARVARCHRG